MFELREAKAKLVSNNKQVVSAPDNNKDINFMPAVQFCTSDTGASAATIVPRFKTESGVYFSVNDGIRVEHKRAHTGKKDGLELYEEETARIYAKFAETEETIKAMAACMLQNPENAIVAICKKVGIPAKWGSRAQAELGKYTHGRPCSAHDVYLCIVEVLAYAREENVPMQRYQKLDDAVAKVLTLRWDDYDIGGLVAWVA